MLVWRQMISAKILYFGFQTVAHRLVKGLNLRKCKSYDLALGCLKYRQHSRNECHAKCGNGGGGRPITVIDPLVPKFREDGLIVTCAALVSTAVINYTYEHPNHVDDGVCKGAVRLATTLLTLHLHDGHLPAVLGHGLLSALASRASLNVAGLTAPAQPLQSELRAVHALGRDLPGLGTERPAPETCH